MMRNYFRQAQVFTFLTVLIICFFCNGQVKKDNPNETGSESKIISDNQTKFIKTQSLNKGDNVHCSLQDKAGNLWFGTTADGVYKYDGKIFTQFTTTNGLNSNSVWCILEDKSDKIWIGTSDGTYLYDDNKFTKIQMNQPNDKINTKYDVWSIIQDKIGKLWFATSAGVYVYDGKLFTSFIVTQEVKNCYFKIETILEDKAGNLWFGGRCNSGIFRYDGKSITNLRPEGDNWAFPVLQDKNGDIWFNNWRGAYRYDGKSFTKFTKNDGLAGDVVTRIIEDKNGALWFGGEGGICRYDGKTFTITKDGLTNSEIWSIMEDKKGNLWVGTRETGLYRFDGKNFTKFSQ